MKRTLINYCGLLGIISLLSYTAAVVFSPLAYPGYNWMAQAVSDLSADSAPSLKLWGQLSALYGICGVVSVVAVCIYAGGKLNRPLRVGIYLFAAMNWVSYVGYKVFPLSDAGSPTGFQNVMHLIVTGTVVLLSVASLVLIIIGGRVRKTSLSLSWWAVVSLCLMLAGAIGVNIVPPAYFGIPERFSVFAAAGFNAVLGWHLFQGFKSR